MPFNDRLAAPRRMTGDYLAIQPTVCGKQSVSLFGSTQVRERAPLTASYNHRIVQIPTYKLAPSNVPTTLTSAESVDLLKV